jgi:amidase
VSEGGQFLLSLDSASTYVAAGLCFAAIGTDTGGSIRFPSSANGIVGLKPTYGRVSRYGVLTFAGSLDHVGPMARSVVDVAIMFDAIAGHDPGDPTSIDAPPPNAFREVGQSIRGLRIGIDRKYALEGVDKGDAAALEEALKVLTGIGAQIVEVRDARSLIPARCLADDCGCRDRAGARRDLPLACERVRSIPSRVPGQRYTRDG